MTIAIVLADDHGVVRAGLRLLLESQPDLKVVGEATNGRDALRAVAQLRPQVAVIDIAMPELNGIEATRQIRAEYPSTQVIILSMYANPEHTYRALRAGARGYVPKESAGDELIKAVRAVCAGRRHLSPKIADEFVDEYLVQRTLLEPESPLELLSAREREVLQLVVEGNSTAQIAEQLALSPKTVDTYRSRLMQKLEIDNLPQLVLFALRHGIISSE
ncbi:MAG: DNA-binding response regulator [Chloroflexi bacterium]|nr:MAG: DNA-binding response regulator [Chloroflexota bacterium]